MRRHETPASIASVLARHAPREMKRILDPAVGNGALLEPFFRRLTRCEVFAVDTDSRPLRRVELAFRSTSRVKLKIVQADFLKWACDYQRRRHSLFDCIVMNPPFAAKKNSWMSLAGLARIVDPYSVPRAGPVEAGFVLGAVTLLKPGGRLLAILPASLITAPCLAWIREFMAAHGAIRHVHELPRFAFPKIEGRIYLVVYEKGRQHNKILLLNHDLLKPEEMLIQANGAASQRLDFRFYSSIRKVNALKERRPLDWRPLRSVAKIWRGTAPTPGISKSVIHTGNYRAGFWRSWRAGGLSTNKALDGAVRVGDILVKRVSRNCARSFGVTDGIRCATASDCVLIIRPKVDVGSIRLLFALRCLMTTDFGPGLLEKGTGASYLAQRELDRFEVPLALSRRYPQSFRLYITAVRRRCFASMLKIEEEVGRRLTRWCEITMPPRQQSPQIRSKRQDNWHSKTSRP
jgi:tRNA1(Val) A37 N6-methylase TrmN6